MSSSTGEGGATAVIGADVGGTHTDVSVILGSRVERGKALTTYDDFSRGVLDAVAVAAARYDLTRDELLARTRVFVNGTTVVTNALIDLKGSPTGVLVTRGFGDTLRFAGGPRVAAIDDHLQVNAPDVVDREAIMETPERIDYAGAVVLPLDEDVVRAQVRELVEERGVEAIAVCFLSSFANPAHELRVAEIIGELHPDVFVTLSHRVAPLQGENRRFTTAVLNSFVQKAAAQYLTSVDAKLREAGLKGGLVFFQGLGGVMSLERAKELPLGLLGSGPAGGATGAATVAARMGLKNVLVGDMGGTSFEAGLLLDGDVTTSKNVQLGLLSTAVGQVDLVSIGAGGGSIAHVSERGVPQVGPESARSTPGPACYGRGGTEPTVTDAMVVMGFIDPDRYLGGAFEIDAGLARTALDERFGRRFGWSTDEAAAGVHDLVVVNMATTLREVSVDKGHDPRDFVFLAYGGTLPLFAVQIAERLAMETVIVPTNSSVFSAMGLLFADFVSRYDQTVNWDLAKLDGVDTVNAITERVVERAVADIVAEGFTADQVEVLRGGDFRFRGQAFELSMPLPDRPLSADDAPRLAADFFTLYERTYGEGTAWKYVPEQMLNATVVARGRAERPEIAAAPPAPRDPSEVEVGRRSVFLPSLREHREIPVYADERFTPGTQVSGPAIVDATDTTIYVPPNATARRDEHHNYILTITHGGQAR
ncbi:MAG TPA: hydantoinase/oxoprolinase family protein [Baekduia sp.]|uniref:hydantoinase/oxoprolinase family protein n=1 Tax=Baekduia sp. TaxID=2600305 RepID=UPI002D76F54B|nr:hydantoinase/oxoprolinase family protein [Baekduia sp.]HET6509964.1 hydantoinase/oxoprolinase family protein [Baekduia sp.]